MTAALTFPTPHRAPDGPDIVQDTNVLRVVAEGLEREYPAVLRRIALLERERVALYSYRDQLQRVAAAAGVALPTTDAAPERPTMGTKSWT